MQPEYTAASLIRSLRKLANMTQSELGEKLGVGKAAVSSYENGKSQPSDAVIARLAKEFDVPISTWGELLPNGVVDRMQASLNINRPLPVNPLIAKTYDWLPFNLRKLLVGSLSAEYETMVLDKIIVAPHANDPALNKGLVVEIGEDSMGPQLRSGMYVLTEELTTTNDWIGARPGVYVVAYLNHLVVKRIRENTFEQSEEIWLYSDETHGGRELVRLSDIRSMWRVLRIVHAPVY
jgi:transcriptional regulator with XRE-family HTH domain